MGQAKKLWMEMEERGDWPSDSLQAKDVCACHFYARWAGKVDPKEFPAKMEIDWVKYYEKVE